MECVIIAIRQKEISEKIAHAIRRNGMDVKIHMCHSTSSILEKARENEKGIILCTKSIQDMNYVELFHYLPIEFEMLILSKDSSIELLSERMGKLLIPFRIAELIDYLYKYLRKVEKKKQKKKNIHIQRTPEEEQIIEKAKAVLMKKHDISEPEAYRMMQKQAMDYGRKLVENAQMILLLNSEW